MATYLQVNNLTKSFGDLVLFRDISFGLEEGQKTGLIAKNGTGKTTLLNILVNKDTSDSGTVIYRNDLKVAYLDQNPSFPEESTVLEACFHSQNEITSLIAEYERISNTGETDKLEDILYKMDYHKAWDYEQRAKQILTRLKITDFDKPVKNLSGGQVKRIALANALITEPDLLILDEPTNHLDLEMTEWLEGFLSRSNLALLMVTHDRYFLDNVCSQIIEIDNKQLYQYKGSYSYYLEKRQERLETQNAEQEKATNLFRKELEWMRRQPQARATKAKARIDSFYELEEKVKNNQNNEQVQLNIKSSYIGNKIFEAKHIYKSFGDLRITDDFNYVFSRYEKMGIVGNNGTGKSTFIKMLMGECPPDKGGFEIGETVKFGYYSQEGLSFNEEMKVIDVVQEIAEVIDLGNGSKLTASQFLQHFLFSPEKQYSYVHKLSGGEKRRLYLCTVLIKNPNFLVLDEPTNDLDIITLNVLEDYLKNFKGCVIVVSHDRYFMDKVVDHLLVFHGNANIQDFPGNYTQYRDWKEAKEKQEKENNHEATIKKAPEKTDQQRKQPKNKLSFKEKKELEELDQLIPVLETEKAEIETSLSSGNLSEEELMLKSERYATLLEEIDEKTLRWLELSEIE